MCRVLNKRKSGIPAGAIYIGRGSKWGNPFRIGPDGDRATVIAKYERWLRGQHHLLRALDELRGHRPRLLLRAAGMPRRSLAVACQRIPRRQGRVVARSNRPSGMEVRLGRTRRDQCGRYIVRVTTP